MSFATLSGVRVVTLSLTIPIYGMWSADVVLATEAPVDTQTKLVVGNLSLKGAVYRQSSFVGRRSCRVIAGYGGWNMTVPKQHYQLEAGVKLSTVIGDAANAVGEHVDVPVDRSLGRDWVRPNGPASDTLRRLAEASWYIDTDGTTRLAAWPLRPVRSQFNVIDFRSARGVAVVATEDFAAWLPGATFSNAVLRPPQKNAGVAIEIEEDGEARLTIMTVTA
jgi:hypothetical protein